MCDAMQAGQLQHVPHAVLKMSRADNCTSMLPVGRGLHVKLCRS